MVLGKKRFNLVVFMLVVLLIPSSLALIILPENTEIAGDYSEPRSFVITVINDGFKVENIELSIDQYSTYLSPYVDISPRRFSLAPNEKSNIQLLTKFPRNLSPEVHTLKLYPRTASEIGPSAEYYFTVPGNPNPNLEVSEIKVDNIKEEDPLLLRIELNNKGNVIAMATPKIEILYNNTIKETINYKSAVQVMPKSRYTLNIRHDNTLLKGDYEIKATFDYNSGLITNTARQGFIVTTEEIKKETDYTGLATFIGIIVAGGIIFLTLWNLLVLLKRKHRESEVIKKKIPLSSHFTHLIKGTEEKRILKIAKRQEKLNIELSSLITETNSFIKESNDWLKEMFGEGKYEFS